MVEGVEAGPTIEHYTAERVPNPYPAGDLPWQVYHTVRNAVLRCCRRHGRAGPMGECPITDGEDTPESWLLADRDRLDFFVVDDQLNHERYVYVEIERPEAFTGEWLRDLVHTLADHDGWGVGIMAWPNAYMLVFADKLMVTGKRFERCRDFDCVVRQGRSTMTP
jgi:hypothetical protein